MSTIRRLIPALLILAFLFSPLAFGGGLFDMPAPEMIYEGTAPGVDAGVLVLRKADAFSSAIRALDPVYGGESPNLKKRTLLRIVGRSRENGCRETVLKEVYTKNFTATVVLEEKIPAAGCSCPAVVSPPKAWLVQVARIVRRAKVQVTDVVTNCDEARAAVDASEIAQIFQGSWDHETGSQILVDAESYQGVLSRLGLGERGPEVDFATHRVVVITARPRSNGCRKTDIVRTELANSSEAVFTIEETYPAKGQMCAQIYNNPKVFLYRVPNTVQRSRIITEEKR